MSDRGQRDSGRSPVVVVGLPRTGTTWMAGAITVGIGGPYLHEPFNWPLDERQRRWALRLLDGPALTLFARAFDEAWAPLGTGPGPVVKDVHALFALAQVAGARDLPTVVAVRHPCAMANSWHELGWSDAGLGFLLDQPALLEDGPLTPWADHLRRCAGDPEAAFGATWGATLTVLDHLAPPRMTHLVHEAMCRSPLDEVRSTLDRLGVMLHGEGGLPALEQWLVEHDRESPDRHSQLRRTAAQPERWRQTLDKDVARRVLAGAEPFGHVDRFYGS